jgi:hypothetical protein
MARLPQSVAAEPALEMAAAGTGSYRKDSGIIEID